MFCLFTHVFVARLLRGLPIFSRHKHVQSISSHVRLMHSSLWTLGSQEIPLPYDGSLLFAHFACRHRLIHSRICVVPPARFWGRLDAAFGRDAGERRAGEKAEVELLARPPPFA